MLFISSFIVLDIVVILPSRLPTVTSNCFQPPVSAEESGHLHDALKFLELQVLKENFATIDKKKRRRNLDSFSRKIDKSNKTIWSAILGIVE